MELGASPKIIFELFEDKNPPERLVASKDVKGATHDQEDGEVVVAEEAEDIEKELIRDDAEGTEARVPGIGGGIKEEEIAKMLDGER